VLTIFCSSFLGEIVHLGRLYKLRIVIETMDVSNKSKTILMFIFFFLCTLFLTFPALWVESLLVAGLYSVLWGKSKECKLVPTCNEVHMIGGCEQDEQSYNKSGNHEVKEETSASAAGDLV
jgi:hypothetical protein